ncbi:MAG: hypothetical protein FJX76_19380 [Armatimonadetes bacterium]|nr:hypothetical protein [Armatimonadota bacterium]
MWLVRYVVCSMPPMAILCAAGIDFTLRHQRAALLLPAIILTLNAAALMSWYGRSVAESDWKTATALVSEMRKEDELVVFDSWCPMHPLNHYLPDRRRRRVLEASEVSHDDVRREVSRHHQVWRVASVENGPRLAGIRRLVARTHSLKLMRDFQGVEVWLHRQPD